ncbi:hypothetical protein BH11PSE12_BH11PSE12_32970 [soil metagenome]
MGKLNLIAAAVISSLCAQAYAADSSTPATEDSTAFDLWGVVTPPVQARSTLVTAAPSAAEKNARSYQSWLNQINKPYANQLATGNGSGIKVGVVDSGVQVDHPELRGRVTATYNAFNGGTDVTDQMGHGTHVSGLIAGSLANGALLEGVASGATLVMAKVFTTGSSDSVTIGKGIDWVVNVQKAPIMSLSLGSSAATLESNIRNAVTKGTLITAALGNDGKSNGASWPAEFAKQSWANGQIIAVGALDSSNKRASFSNVDATLANWTVYAPGVNVASSYSVPTAKNAYAYMSGTSMATPIVAGQAALIKSNWNFLTASDLSGIIFQSATHLCSDSVSAAVCAARKTADSMYGWGLINVGASLQPIGSLNIGTQSGTAVSYAGTSLATPKSGMATGLAGVNTVAVDKFNRGFTVNLASVVTAKATSTSATPVTSASTTTVKGAKYSAEYSYQAGEQNAWQLDGKQAALTVAKSSYSYANDTGMSYGFGVGGTTSSFFGLDASGSTPLSLNGEGSRFNTPYFGLVANASHMGYGTTFSDGSVMRLGMVMQSAGVTSALMGTTDVPAGSKTLLSTELQKNIGGVTGVVTLGMMQESNAMLGMSGTGALAMGGKSSTNFVTIAGSKDLFEKTTLSAMASLGYTRGQKNLNESLINSVSSSTSAAWSMGLAQKDWLRKGDQLGFTAAMPLRTMSGDMNLTTAVSQSQVDGSLQYANQSIGLAPSGSEKDFELAYSRPMSFGGKLTVMGQYKLQPGHIDGAASQYGIGLRYGRSF